MAGICVGGSAWGATARLAAMYQSLQLVHDLAFYKRLIGEPCYSAGHVGTSDEAMRSLGKKDN